VTLVYLMPSKVIKFEDPNVLKQRLDLTIPKDPLSLDVIINDCQQTIDHAVRTGTNNA
jgi:hypothetical protein